MKKIVYNTILVCFMMISRCAMKKQEEPVRIKHMNQLIEEVKKRHVLPPRGAQEAVGPSRTRVIIDSDARKTHDAFPSHTNVEK
jgi:hypothetical protein